MILAAGKGERMRPLTDSLPKPLLTVLGKPIITYHLTALAKAGIRDIVINLGHLGDKIVETLGDGSRFNVNIQYSYEDPILETAGGIKQALPLLGEEPFIAVSGDILTDFNFSKLPTTLEGLAHLVLTENPPHHPKGDFALQNGLVVDLPDPLLTAPTLFNFAGIGVYSPEFFENCPKGAYPLGKLFKTAIKSKQITGEFFKGVWYNIGTPEQLKDVEKSLL